MSFPEDICGKGVYAMDERQREAYSKVAHSLRGLLPGKDVQVDNFLEALMELLDAKAEATKERVQ